MLSNLAAVFEPLAVVSHLPAHRGIIQRLYQCTIPGFIFIPWGVELFICSTATAESAVRKYHVRPF